MKKLALAAALRQPVRRKLNLRQSDLVSMWDDFIDWPARRAAEKGFFERAFEKRWITRVFDACCGTGCDSIHLIKQGLQVTSNEVDSVFRKKARENAERNGVRLKLTAHDWRDIKLEDTSFDAVICLGNSLCYLFGHVDRIKALSEFRRLLRTRGILIIDERNFQRIFDNKDTILADPRSYTVTHVYCGKEVIGYPTEIKNDRIVMEYLDLRNGKTAHLVLYPFKQGELRQLLIDAGFRPERISTFSDYEQGVNPNADFYQYVCVKS
ncbi:class I SAM-dependent methyltransferase [Candidatus Micrarchaeota archaeon]|nr:class I SAM-dependent methyltransferase [Candidatus Micrarchaeota archaeon]